MSHVNARLTVHGRRLIVDRVAAGRPVAHIAAELGVSRQTGRPLRPETSDPPVRGLPGHAQLGSDMGDRPAGGHPVNDQESSMNRQPGINVGHEDLRAQSV